MTDAGGRWVMRQRQRNYGGYSPNRPGQDIDPEFREQYRGSLKRRAFYSFLGAATCAMAVTMMPVWLAVGCAAVLATCGVSYARDYFALSPPKEETPSRAAPDEPAVPAKLNRALAPSFNADAPAVNASVDEKLTMSPLRLVRNGPGVAA